MRILKDGEAGNCSAIAWTKFHYLVKAGYSPDVKLCQLKEGEYHAYVVVDGWALDNRMDSPVRPEEIGCE